MRMGHVHHYPDGASASKDLHFGVTIDGPDYEEWKPFGFHGQRVEAAPNWSAPCKARSPPLKTEGPRSSTWW